MSEHRYPLDSLTGDYLRAGAGVTLCGGPLVLVNVGFWPFVVLGGLTTLFAYFGWRTWRRHMTVLTLSETGVAAHSQKLPQLSWLNATLPWPELRRYKLSYFSTKRDKSDGWMQLTLRGAGRKLQIDSAIEGFDELARQAFRAARRNGIELSQTTLGNLDAIRIADSEASEGWGDPADWAAPRPEPSSPSGSDR